MALDVETIKEIAALQENVKIFTRVIDKLDLAIGKLSDVAGQMDKILTEHDMRIKQNEVFKQEMEVVIEKLNKKIDDRFKTLEDSVDKLSNWRWFVVGITTAVIFFFTQIIPAAWSALTALL